MNALADTESFYSFFKSFFITFRTKELTTIASNKKKKTTTTIERWSTNSITHTLNGTHTIAAPVFRLDQKKHLKAITAAFVAEHCLLFCFSLVPHLMSMPSRCQSPRMYSLESLCQGRHVLIT